jgi:hypothetical protein
MDFSPQPLSQIRASEEHPADHPISLDRLRLLLAGSAVNGMLDADHGERRIMGDTMAYPPQGFPCLSLTRRLPGIALFCLSLAVVCGGCWGGAASGPGAEILDRVGRTYYLDGAGNWGYGVASVSEGLRRAGYQGNVVNFRWSPTLNPALDQTVGRVVLRDRAKDLAKEVCTYLGQYPRNEVNVIALSAGTGVAVYACESLEPPAKVNNLIMLGSSLSADYDMGKALGNITGHVWVYYSPNDAILVGPVRIFGTIDGRLITDAAGLVGLHPPHDDEGKIRNVGWNSKWEPYGWTGTHTDATSEPFVEQELARHILHEDAGDAPAAGVPAGFQKPQPAARPAMQTVAGT